MRRYLLATLVLLLSAAMLACGNAEDPEDTATPPSGSADAAGSAAATGEEPQASKTPESSPTPETVPTATPIPEPTAAPLPELTSAAEIIGAATAAMQEVDSFHFKMDMKIEADIQGMSLDVPMTFEGDYQAPDRFKGVMSISLGFISITTEMVSIGPVSYVKDTETGAWTVSVGDAALFSDPNEFISSDADALAGIELVGQETLDGTDVFLLQGTVPIDTFGDTGDDFDVSYWIDAQKILLRQVTGKGAIAMSENNPLFGGIGGGGDIEFTMSFSAFGEPVQIDAPNVDPEVVKNAELVGLQTAMDAMMANKGISNVTASGSSTNSWTDNPTGTGAAPLSDYLPVKTSTFFYCWDAQGRLTRQDESSAAC